MVRGTFDAFSPQSDAHEPSVQHAVLCPLTESSYTLMQGSNLEVSYELD